jgi:hypothetical protein
MPQQRQELPAWAARTRARPAPSAGRDLAVPPEPRHMAHVRFTTQHVSGRTLDGSHWSFRHADAAQRTEELSCTRSFGRAQLVVFQAPARSGAPPL